MRNDRTGLMRAAGVIGMAAALAMFVLPARAQDESGDTPIAPVSQLAGLKFIPLAKLPAAPKAAGDSETCSNFIVQPTSPEGRLVTARGWSVTGEAKVGALQAISFASRFEQGTSGTCSILDGNVAVFGDGRLIALAYAERSSKQTIGRIAGLENGTARVWDGDILPTPVGDIELGDDSVLKLRKVAGEDRVCGGKAAVPDIVGMPIDKARAALAAKGWNPAPGEPKTDPDQFGREMDLIKRGIVEVDSCAGTGLAYCSFKYRGTAGSLSVTTAGEDDLPQVVSYGTVCR